MQHTFLLLQICSALAAFPWQHKISQDVVNTFKSKDTLNIFVSFKNTQEVLSTLNFQSMSVMGGQKSSIVHAALNAHADASQRSAIATLQADHFPSKQFKTFWISNKLYVAGAGASLINKLAQLADVLRIDEEVIIQLSDPVANDRDLKHVNGSWGITKIQTNEAWAVAGRGQGAVVGVIDSGARVSHEAIKRSYRGGSHSWYDPYSQSPEPFDDNGHGSHVTGTITGMYGIGVVPDARWISCKGLDEDGFGTESALTACAEFMLCPTNHLGGSPNCNLSPHVVSNSWGTTPGRKTFFDDAIAAWHVAGIIPIFSAGNNGPSCDSVGSPADSRSDVIAVAASDWLDKIAPFSSRGPSDHSGRHVSDITAPGVDIVSAGISDDSSYTVYSGTSMACPHVAGVAALLKSQRPNATYQEIREVLMSTSDTNFPVAGNSCGGTIGFPNYVFGHGRINALSAVNAFRSEKE